MITRRVLCFVISLLLICGINICNPIRVNSSNLSWHGTGTAENPYVISNETALIKLANDVNSGTSYSNTYFVLSVNIELTSEWTPIGNSSNPFCGIFDGNGYVINGLYIDKPQSEFIGLFGSLGTGTNKAGVIKNLGVIISNKGVKGNASVGGIAGRSYGNIFNCYVTGGEITTSTSWAGGIAGLIDGKITNCYSTVNITGSNNIGGIVGHGNGSNSIVSYCYSTGKINCNNVSGGILGCCTATVSNCVALNDSTVKTSGDSMFRVGQNAVNNNFNNYALNKMNAAFSSDIGVHGKNIEYADFYNTEFWAGDTGVFKAESLNWMFEDNMPPKLYIQGTTTLIQGQDNFAWGDYLKDKVSVKSSEAEHGQLLGAGEFLSGDEVTLAALPDDGYVLDGWYENNQKLNELSQIYTFTAIKDRTIEAKFVAVVSHMITVIVGKGGSVSGGNIYIKNSVAELIAIPNPGYIFQGWYENNTKLDSIDEAFTFYVLSDRTLEARFNTRKIDPQVDYDKEIISISDDFTISKKATVMYALNVMDNPKYPATEKWYPLYGDELNISKLIPQKPDSVYKIAFRIAGDTLAEDGYPSRTVVTLEGRPNSKLLKLLVNYDPLTESIVNDYSGVIQIRIGESSNWIDIPAKDSTSGETGAFNIPAELLPWGALAVVRIKSMSIDTGSANSFASAEYKLRLNAQPKGPNLVYKKSPQIKGYYISGSKDTMEIQVWNAEKAAFEWEPISKNISSADLEALLLSEGAVRDNYKKTNDNKSIIVSVRLSALSNNKKPASAVTELNIPLESIKGTS